MLSRIAVLFMGVLGVLASGTSALALQAGRVEGNARVLEHRSWMRNYMPLRSAT